MKYVPVGGTRSGGRREADRTVRGLASADAGRRSSDDRPLGASVGFSVAVPGQLSDLIC